MRPRQPNPTIRVPAAATRQSQLTGFEEGVTRMFKRQRFSALLVILVCPALVFAGTVSGKVTYIGTPAKMKPIDMSREPTSANQPASPRTTEGVVTVPILARPSLVEYVSAGAPDDASARAQAVTFTQKG